MATTKATNLGHRSDVTLKGTTTTVESNVVLSDTTTINNAGSDVGLKINSTSSGHIMQLQDGGTDVMVVADGGSTTFSLEDGVTNAVTTVATLRHTSSGTTANGFGTGLRFEGEQPNGGTNIPMASINTVWSNGSAEESDLRFQTGDGGVLSDVMTLTKDGNVGIGTDSPTGTLHVQQSSTGISGSSSDVLTLEKDAETVSINMISDTDRKSNILFSDTTRAQGRIQFDQSSRELSLWTSDASPQLLIDSSGKVGIGTTSPVCDFHVSGIGAGGEGFIRFATTDTGGSEGILLDYVNCSPDNAGWAFYFKDDTTARCIIRNDGDLNNHDNSYGSLSDERIKTGIKDANSQWDDVKAIRVRNFTRKDDVAKYGDKAWEQIGVIAQEAELVSPKLIKENIPSQFELEHCGFGEQNEDGNWMPKKDENGKDVTVKSMKYSILQMKAFKALQEAMTKIETLEAKVTALENATN